MEKRQIISISVLTLIVMSCAGLFVWPSYQNWDRERRSLLGTTKAIAETNQQQTAVDALQKSQGVIESKARLALSLIPTEQDREDFITQLDELARVHQLSLGALNFSDTVLQAKTSKNKTKSGIKATTYTATVSGSYQDFHQFVSKLPGLNRFTQLATVSISTKDIGVTASVSGSIYSKESPKIPAKLAIEPATWKYLDDYRVGETIELIPGQGRSNPFSSF